MSRRGAGLETQSRRLFSPIAVEPFTSALSPCRKTINGKPWKGTDVECRLRSKERPGDVGHTKSKSCRYPGPRVSLAIPLAALFLVRAMQGQGVEEYQMKAAILYNLAKFIEWPSNTFKNPTDPITSCVLGDTPFGRSLDLQLNGKAIDDRKVVVRHVSEISQARGCQILMITNSVPKRRSNLNEIKTSGILTVGEADDFASGGGVVNLKLESGKVRIQINVEAAEREGLRISSRLLNLAQIVKK
jgi:YfiR/HmsC-like